MSLIQVYENYRREGFSELEAVGATFLNESIINMNREQADLKMHVNGELIENITNDCNSLLNEIEEDKNERITTAV